MKKALLSLAVLAASGTYIAAANHALPIGHSQQPDKVDVAPAMAGDQKAPTQSMLSTATTSKIPASAGTPAATAPTATVVAATPPVIAPQPPVSMPPVNEGDDAETGSAAIAAASPPIPAPRPADAPRPTIQTAQANSSAVGGQYRDGTYDGNDDNAYYGRVKVEVTIANQRIVGVKALDYPSDRRTSRSINSQALPLLRQEVIAAQDANVDIVSGATLTSEAYIKSLHEALAKAIGNRA